MYDRSRYDERDLFERRGYPDMSRGRADFLAPPLPRRDMPPLPTLGTRREPSAYDRPAAAFDGYTRRSPPAAARFGYVRWFITEFLYKSLTLHVMDLVGLYFAWCNFMCCKV